MNAWPEADAILGSLRTWYEATRAEAQQHATAGGATDEPWRGEPDIGQEPLRGTESAQELGLLRLVEEFTALRQEVKLQTKASRGTQQQAQDLLAGLEQTLDRLRPTDTALKNASQGEVLPWVEALADLDDALCRAQSELEQIGPRTIETLSRQLDAAALDAQRRLPAWRRWLARRIVRAEPASDGELGAALAPWLRSWSDGYRLLHSRLKRHMQRGGLERMECLGHALDPHFMTAVQIVPDSAEPPGTVLAEIRGGYIWQGRVIRFAEVSVAGGGVS